MSHSIYNQKRIIAFSVIAAAVPSFWMGAAYSNQPAQAAQAVTIIERIVCLPGEGIGKKKATESTEPSEQETELAPRPIPSATPDQAPRPMPSIIITDTMGGQK
jgi:hypothetical protein